MSPDHTIGYHCAVSSSLNLTTSCLDCMCSLMTGCNATAGCNKFTRDFCGPLAISKNYWIDGGKCKMQAKRPKGLPKDEDKGWRCKVACYCVYLVT